MKRWVGILLLASAPVATDAASLSGIVVTSELNPLPGASVVLLAGDESSVFTFTDVEGTYSFPVLPGGLYEVEVRPPAGLPYAEITDMVLFLEPGEARTRLAFRVPSAGFLHGQVVDSSGNPVPDLAVAARGPDGFDGVMETDADGRFEFRAPVGPVLMEPDEVRAEHRFTPFETAVSEVGGTNELPAIVAYAEEDGGRLAGTVSNPDGTPHVGEYLVASFSHDQVLNAALDTFVIPVAIADWVGPAWQVSGLPPDHTYDVAFALAVWYPDGDLQSFTIRGWRLDVPVGESGIDFAYQGEGMRVSGRVRDASRPVPGIPVLLMDSLDRLIGYAETSSTGEFVYYNVPAGAYQLRVRHNRYRPADVPVLVGIAPDPLPPILLTPRRRLHLRQEAGPMMQIRWLHEEGWTPALDVTGDLLMEDWPVRVSPLAIGPHGLNRWTDDGVHPGMPPTAGTLRAYRLDFERSPLP